MKLNVNDLQVKYGAIVAVKGISFYVNEGEIVTLIGANGAGKTSTLRTITGLEKAAKGSISYGNQEITKMPAHNIVKLGIIHVPEGRRIFTNFTVIDNLKVAASHRTDHDGVKQDLEEVFERFPRLKERCSQSASTLSGGEQQMLAVGRAMMQAGNLILLDEPSMGLAPKFVEEIFNVIKILNQRGKTILLNEQNAYMALSIADRAYVLETGSITIEGKARDLLNDPRVKEAYLGS